MTHNSAGGSLKKLCCAAVREHFISLGTEAIVSLPTPLIKDLLPHLTVCQLDAVQPALNQRGISTSAAWLAILEELWSLDHAIKFPTEKEAKQEVMTCLFRLVLYGKRNRYINKNQYNLDTSFLWTAANCITHFFCKAWQISSPKVFKSLTSGPQSLLKILEKRIRTVTISDSMDLLKETTQPTLYILHCLLDHGPATELVVNVPSPIMLAWLLHGRGSQYVNLELKNLMDSRVLQTSSTREDGAGHSPGLLTMVSNDQSEEDIPCKRSKLDSACLEDDSGKLSFTVHPQVLCQNFSQCGSNSAVPCSSGRIEVLKIQQCEAEILRVLVSALPTFFSLCSLSLHRSSKFSESDVLGLASALKQLSNSSRGKITDLTMNALPTTKLIEKLLDASTTLTSLHVEVQNMIWGPGIPLDLWPVQSHRSAPWPLQKLQVKVNEFQSSLNFMTYVLRHSPHLTSLHLAGLRLPTGSSLSPLLTTLSECNHCLKTLILEDMKLSDCLTEILNLLKNCQLEELRFNDCRLLETCSNKEESLLQLVTALKKVSSLHTLSLAQNRLARNVCVLAELFSGPPSSSMKHLDISSNFIQPAELLEFAKRLRTYRPPHKLIIDLRKNPADRDPDTWDAALQRLRPFTLLLSMGWKSTNMMVDHISNM